jgi:hypothetical protein
LLCYEILIAIINALNDGRGYFNVTGCRRPLHISQYGLYVLNPMNYIEIRRNALEPNSDKFKKRCQLFHGFFRAVSIGETTHCWQVDYETMPEKRRRRAKLHTLQ